MFNFFDLNIISTFLSRFEVEKILITGLSNERILNEIISFGIDNNSVLYAVDSKIDIKDINLQDFNENDINKYIDVNVKYFNNNSLEVLSDLNSFDAIFINDDPNWYTVYNELNLIKNNHASFPLVFVCNNKYPHKRRDSYINPENIPDEYKNEYSDELIIEYVEDNNVKSVVINDGFYHAVNKNTPKNGVLTAIEDFLKENYSLKLLEISPLEGISLIYNNSNISYIRVNKILETETQSEYPLEVLSDKFVENNLLLKNFAGINLLKNDVDQLNKFKLEMQEKNSQLENFENEIELHDLEIKYKDSQLDNMKNQVNLKETQIQSIESKLINKDDEIKSKETELEITKNKLNDMENNCLNYKQELENTKKQLFEVNNKYKFHGIIENKYKELLEINNEEIENKNKELQSKKTEINFLKSKLGGSNNAIQFSENHIADNVEFDVLKSEYLKQFSRINSNEYCIRSYKERINNNDIEIEYLKKSDRIRKKLFNPLAYLFIISKSKVSEILINIKLYRTLKNSSCFDIGYYLNKYPDIPKSKWCKYFSPELHYVCKGFDENRKFNKRYYNNKNKRELIKDIKNIKCN